MKTEWQVFFSEKKSCLKRYFYAFHFSRAFIQLLKQI